MNPNEPTSKTWDKLSVDTVPVTWELILGDRNSMFLVWFANPEVLCNMTKGRYGLPLGGFYVNLILQVSRHWHIDQIQQGVCFWKFNMLIWFKVSLKHSEKELFGNFRGVTTYKIKKTLLLLRSTSQTSLPPKQIILFKIR